MTISVPFTTEPERRAGFPCTAFRWSFQLDRGFIGFVHQHHIDGKWRDSHVSIWGVAWNGEWAWGEVHFYYDGPHCMFRAGPLTVQWVNLDCPKCWGEK